MSSFIELKQGILVNSEMIEGIISISDSKKPDIMCMVYTANNKYPSVLSKEIILQMIYKQTNKEDNIQEQMLNIAKQETSVMGG